MGQRLLAKHQHEVSDLELSRSGILTLGTVRLFMLFLFVLPNKPKGLLVDIGDVLDVLTDTNLFPSRRSG